MKRVTAAFDHGKCDFLICSFLIILTLSITIACLNDDHSWGDDWAAYMAEGIAIADGSFEEQIKNNMVLHPGGRDVDGDSLVYAWGFPLILSLVYKAVGFQPPGYQLIFYKIPGVAFFIILIPCLYAFFRKNLNRITSFLLTTTFCMNAEFYKAVNVIATDIPFFACSVIVYLLSDAFYFEKSNKRRLVKGIVLGVCIWYCSVLRLNGITLLFFVIVAGITGEIHSGIQENKNRHAGQLAWILLPCLVVIIANSVARFYMPEATSNTSDIQWFSLRTFSGNILNYLRILFSWCNSVMLIS